MTFLTNHANRYRYIKPFYGNVFNEFFNGVNESRTSCNVSTNAKKSVSPDVDIIETSQHYHLNIDLPGVVKDDIHVNIEDGVLLINAERSSKLEPKADTEDEKQTVVRQERFYGHYERQFSVGENIDASGVQATYTEGVLSLTLPKVKEEKAVTQKISIN